MKRLEVDVAAHVGALELQASLDTGSGALVVTGANGAGKTSLLLAVLGVIRVAAGRIALGERVLFDRDAGIDVPAEERRLGYVPQGSGLFSHLNARENVEFALGCRSPRLGRRARRERALAWLAELGVSGVAEQPAERLSGGERQLVALARALASDPEALLLDEPFAALDPAAKDGARGLVRRYLERTGVPALVVSHDPADALALGRRLAVVEPGRIVQEGRLSELAARPASPTLARLLAAVASRAG